MPDNTTLPNGGDTIATDDLTSLNGAGVSGVKMQRVKPSWGVDGTAVDASATNPFPTSQNASIFRFSTNNSSTAQLVEGATFTGVIETALDQPSISILMTSDQPMQVVVYQYIDLAGVYAATPIVINVGANQGLSTSFALNGNYVNVKVTNLGRQVTTTFNLNTAYGNLPSSDTNGKLPVSYDQADAIVFLLSAMLEKMPRMTANDQAAVSIEAGSVGIAASQTLATVTNVTTVNSTSLGMGVSILQHNINMPTYIYDKVVVS